MYKSALKYCFIVCAVLFVGQIDINQRQLGSYFASGIKGLVAWTGDRLLENPIINKVIHPKGLNHWFPFGEMSRRNPSLVGFQASVGPIIDDKNKLNEEDDEPLNETEDISETEIQPETDDAAVMAILP